MEQNKQIDNVSNYIITVTSSLCFFVLIANKIISLIKYVLETADCNLSTWKECTSSAQRRKYKSCISITFVD